MNYQSLAPPITKANAAEFARRATIARERNRATRKQEILASPGLYARKEVELEIHRVRVAMKHEPVTSELYGKLVQRLDILWNKAFPTQAAVRPQRQRRSFDELGASPTPQTMRVP